MKKLFPIFLFLLVMISSVFAGDNDTLVKTKIKFDTNYIANYRYKLQVRTVGLNQQSSINLVNTDIDKNLNFATNNPFEFGVAIDYSWITLEYTQSIKGFELTDYRKGKSESFALNVSLNARKFSGGLYYRNTSGFNLENIDDWVPTWFEENEKYPYAENISTRILAGNIYYNFNNKKFSTAAAYRQNDRQLKSAGSPLVGILANIEGVYAPTPMIDIDSLDGKFLNIRRVQYLKAGVFGGYMHTFSIYKRFFIHGSLNQGFLYSIGNGEYHDTEETQRLSAVGVSIFARLALGYNGTKWFAGTLFSADFFVSDVSSELTSSTGYTLFKIYVGYRFKFWNKPILNKFKL
jgi:hypothetical protein